MECKWEIADEKLRAREREEKNMYTQTVFIVWKLDESVGADEKILACIQLLLLTTLCYFFVALHLLFYIVFLIFFNMAVILLHSHNQTKYAILDNIPSGWLLITRFFGFLIGYAHSSDAWWIKSTRAKMKSVSDPT